MQCLQCQHENRDTANFCESCGRSLARRCPACDQEVRAGATFCDQCGTPLGTLPPTASETLPIAQDSPPTSTSVASEAERRHLSVMFCDLVGSTVLSGQLDPEDLRDVIRAYQEAAADVIQRYDGYIAQYLGDGLLVYFGYPVAHEDDAQRAVHAGLGIVEAIAASKACRTPDDDGHLTVRVGIHTGPVVVGEMGGGGRHEQLALGETPNVTARLQGLAAPDTVVISADTYELVQGYFHCDPLGEHGLRGLSQPLAVYRVLRESGVQNRLDVVAARGLTPLVGRHSERQLMIDRWNQAKSGEGQVVLLNAEPGLGKSRMVQALREYLVEESYTHLECRSSPYYQHSALYPVIDLMQRILQWEQDDSADDKLDKLERTLAQFRLNLGETVPLLSAVLSLSPPVDRYPPLNLTPQRQRQKTLDTIAAMVLEWAERQPVLLVVEDLHWIDPSTLEMLDLVIDQVPTASIYIVMTCRPEFQAKWSSRSYFTQLTLNRLSYEDVEQMVASVTDGKPLPPEIVQHLVDKTDGVPLYIEEMTKSVLESGVLMETNGQYEQVGPLSSLAIPTTLQDSLMARLDRLVTAKAVAQYASVIGRQFTYDLLQRVSQLDVLTLRRELVRLVEAELVYQRGVIPHATYMFKHVLVQDIAYQSLLRNTRQTYHRRIAEVLEERFAGTVETQPELLAHHYTAAGLNEQAMEFWQRAGERAMQRSAYVEAVSHLTKGLSLLPSLPASPTHLQRELALQAPLAQAMMALHGYGAADVGHAFDRARTLCQQLGDPPELFRILWGLFGFYIARAEHQPAQEVADQLSRIAQRQEDPVLLMWRHWSQGTIDFMRGEFTSTRQHMEQVLTLYDPQHHRPVAALYGQDPAVSALSWLAMSLWSLGYPDQALDRIHEALALAQDLGHPFSEGRALLFTPVIHLLRREGPEAQERADQGLALAIEQGFALYAQAMTVLRGVARVFQGQADNELAAVCKELEDLQAGGQANFQTSMLALLGEAYGHAGQVAAGLSLLEEAQNLMEQTGERFGEAELYRLTGELQLRQSPDNIADAEFLFRQAVAVAQNQSAKSAELRVATSLARLWQSQSKRHDAYHLLAPVYEWFTEGFDTADLIEAKYLLDELSADISSPML